MLQFAVKTYQLSRMYLVYCMLAKHVCLAEAFSPAAQHDIDKRTNSLLEKNKRKARKIIFLQLEYFPGPLVAGVKAEYQKSKQVNGKQYMLEEEASAWALDYMACKVGDQLHFSF